MVFRLSGSPELVIVMREAASFTGLTTKLSILKPRRGKGDRPRRRVYYPAVTVVIADYGQNAGESFGKRAG